MFEPPFGPAGAVLTYDNEAAKGFLAANFKKRKIFWKLAAPEQSARKQHKKTPAAPETFRPEKSVPKSARRSAVLA
jgi:hypothetical protein